VNKTLDLETVLSTIAAKAVQLSNTDAGAIYVFDDAQRLFRLRATYGMDRKLIDALTHQRIDLDGVDVALPLTRGEIFQVADLREEPATPLNQIILAAGYRALLAAPLVRGADIVGVLVIRRRTPVCSRGTPSIWSTLSQHNQPWRYRTRAYSIMFKHARANWRNPLRCCSVNEATN
jgi:signal transduction protein with GAF and PtsI domain